jgi:hypothetical protein
MHRSLGSLGSLASRRFLLIAIGLLVAAGIGVGAYFLGSASKASATSPIPRAQTSTVTPPTPRDVPAPPAEGLAADPSTPPAEAPAADALTLDEAKAIAAETAPGQVVEWDEDQEPTGLRWDITLVHDNGTSTEVEVDTVTGQVTSINHDNDYYWD